MKEKDGEDDEWGSVDEESWEEADEEVGVDGVQVQMKEDTTTQSFSIVDMPASGGPSSSASFQIVDSKMSKTGADDNSTQQEFGIESISSIQGKDKDCLDSSSQHSFGAKKPGKTGKTREEVFLGLKIKKAELLPTGEVRLGNGKIIGTRKWRYLYKQRPRPVDEREAVIINKVALEYRKLRAL